MKRYRIVRILIFVVTPESITIAYCLAMFGGICYGCAGLGQHYHSKWPRGGAPADHEETISETISEKIKPATDLRFLLLEFDRRAKEALYPAMAIAGPAGTLLSIDIACAGVRR